MRNVSIRELHAHAAELVREAAQAPLVVTDRDREVAIVATFSPEQREGAPFPRRRANDLPKLQMHSTAIIREDRDGR